MIQNLRKLLILIFLSNIITISSYSIEPDVFVQSTVNRASEILSKNISREEKINRLKIIAKDTEINIQITKLNIKSFGVGLNAGFVFNLAHSLHLGTVFV